MTKRLALFYTHRSYHMSDKVNKVPISKHGQEAVKYFDTQGFLIRHG